MFEEEAIRYAFEYTIGVECLIKPVEDFTYEELDDEQQEKAYDYQKGAEFGYNKANDWHYVKDGDFPPEDTKVLALMAGGEVCIAHFYRKNVWDKIGIVIAWKEIVLPKEIENEL